MNLTGFEQRLSEAFGYASRPQIASKMGLNYQTLSNWLTGRTEFPTKELAKIANLTDFSLNWILTGNGEKRTAKPAPPSIIDLDNLDAFVRGIVRDEMGYTVDEDVGGEVDPIEPVPRDSLMLAPVIAHIGPGVKPQAGRTIQPDQEEEIKRRLQVRKKKTG